MTKSQFGDRDTVGTIALQAALSNDNPTAGDLGYELMPSLVEDLNECISSNPYEGRDFYITINEKKDAQLTNTILRRLVTTEKRPYPEPNTSVFWTSPKRNETLFCWSLPHQSEFGNYIANPTYYEEEQLNDIKEYLAENLSHFGFFKFGEHQGRPILLPIPKFKDRRMGKEKDNLYFKPR